MKSKGNLKIFCKKLRELYTKKMRVKNRRQCNVFQEIIMIGPYIQIWVKKWCFVTRIRFFTTLKICYIIYRYII